MGGRIPLLQPLRGERMRASEIIFEATESLEGGFEARALGFSIFTEADSWDQLKVEILDAVRCHFDDEELPRLVRIHLVKDEVIAV
jgi:hypothetical protein